MMTATLMVACLAACTAVLVVAPPAQAADVPASTSPPLIVGDAWPGQQLICLPGEWSPPALFSFSWSRDSADLAVDDGPTYVVGSDDVGTQLRCRVEAREGDSSSGVAESQPIPVLAAAPTPPLPPPPPAASSANTSVGATALETRCVVPRIGRITLRAARKRIAAAGCRVGTIRRQWSRSVKKGRVLRVSRRAGRSLAAGTRIKLVVSKGPRPARRARR